MLGRSEDDENILVSDLSLAIGKRRGSELKHFFLLYSYFAFFHSGWLLVFTHLWPSSLCPVPPTCNIHSLFHPTILNSNGSFIIQWETVWLLSSISLNTDIVLIITATSNSMLDISGGEKCSLFATSKSHSFLLDPIFSFICFPEGSQACFDCALH